jgi:hypothetical protein
MAFSADFFGQDGESRDLNSLMKYLQHQSPEVLARVARSASPEIKEVITQNVQGLLGMLPSDNFNVQVSTNRENLAGLLASAMMTGYFLRQMEQRMELEVQIMGTPVASPFSEPLSPLTDPVQPRSDAETES